LSSSSIHIILGLSSSKTTKILFVVLEPSKYTPCLSSSISNKNEGSIILTSSVGGSKGFEGVSVYSATKAAVRSFARSWTVDLKHRKIRVNAVSPGMISTPMLSGQGMGLIEEQVEQFKKTVLNNVPLGRVGNPDEIAKAVVFLASDDSSYITGIELFADGGLAQI
jgi:NAD(P)-dependent dehydrogenase (short-subunit alcohol dehydrogenase family)